MSVHGRLPSERKQIREIRLFEKRIKKYKSKIIELECEITNIMRGGSIVQNLVYNEMKKRESRQEELEQQIKDLEKEKLIRFDKLKLIDSGFKKRNKGGNYV